MSQISAIERLQSLPPIFRGADLTVRFQWSSKTASQYLYLWRQRQLVAGLGGHSDVYANLLLDRQPNWGSALLFAMPSAVVVGVEALRLAGWTTQIQHRPSVAVRADQSVFTTTHFDVEKRDSAWFDQVSDGVVKSAGQLPYLAPAWALADMIKSSGRKDCPLHPDDIEPLEISEKDLADFDRACAVFEINEHSCLAFRESLNTTLTACI